MSGDRTEHESEAISSCSGVSEGDEGQSFMTSESGSDDDNDYCDSGGPDDSPSASFLRRSSRIRHSAPISGPGSDQDDAIGVTRPSLFLPNDSLSGSASPGPYSLGMVSPVTDQERSEPLGEVEIALDRSMMPGVVKPGEPKHGGRYFRAVGPTAIGQRGQSEFSPQARPFKTNPTRPCMIACCLRRDCPDAKRTRLP